MARQLHLSRYMSTCASIFRRLPLRLAAALTGLAVAAAAAAAIEPLAGIRGAAERFVRAQMPPQQSGIVVSAARLDPRLRLARCAGPLEASLLSGARLAASMSVAVGCHAGADWTIYVPVTLRSQIRVWALRKPEAEGARLRAADVVAETRLVAGVAVGYVTDLAALGRSSLRHPLPAGAVLKTTDLLADFMVRQGEQVSLVASLGGIRVRARGVALQAGRYGELIRVQNLSSLKVVQGIVQDGTVVYVTP